VSDLDRRGAGGWLRLHGRVGSRDRLATAHGQEKHGLADLDVIPILEHTLFDRHAVHKGAVEAVQIAEHDAIASPHKRAVPARELRIGNVQAIRGAAADRHLARLDIDDRSLYRAGENEHARVHRVMV
jgi:hypothetical protein